MSEETARLVERLRTRLQRAIYRVTWAEITFGTVVSIGSLAALWLVAAILESSLWFGTDLRTGLVFLIGGVAIALVATFLARPVARLLGLSDDLSEEDIARAVGEQYPVVDDRLVNLLQLVEGKGSHAPAPFVDRAVQQLAQQIDTIRVEEVADFRPAKKAGRIASLPLLALLTFLLTAPSTFLGASERLLAPQTQFDRPAPFQLSIAPGDVRLVRGDSLCITVRATGSAPSTAAVLLRPSDDNTASRRTLRSDSSGTFQYLVPNLRQSLRYRVVAPPVRSEWYTVDVARRPLLRQLQVRVAPPSYTRLSPRTLASNAGDITALPGSRVSIIAALGGPPVSEAALVFENGTQKALTVQDDSATGEFVVTREGSYHLRLRSEKGIPNRDPIQYEISLQPDAPPSASFLEPAAVSDLTPSLTKQLRLQLSDDFGFRRVELFYRLAEDEGSGADTSFSSITLPLPETGTTDQVITHEWLLTQESNLNIERGETVLYFAKVWDNDLVNGPKSSRTPIQRLRFPSLSEQYEELDKTEKQASKQMEDLQRQAQTLRQQFQKLREELRRTREADWEDRRQVERLQQKQDSLEQTVENMSREVEAMNRKMKRNDLSSPETTQKFQELKEAIEGTKSPEMREALKKLRKSMTNEEFPQIQKSLENTSRQFEQRSKRLNRVKSLLQTLKVRQNLEELTRRTQDLRDQQREIAEKTEKRTRKTVPSDSSRRSSKERSNKKPIGDKRPSDSTSTASDSEASPRPDSTGAPSDSVATARPDSANVPSDSTSIQELASDQKRAAQQMKKLMESLKETERQMKDVPSAPQKQMKKLNENIQRENLPRRMQKSSQQLRKNKPKNAQRQQRDIQNQLRRLQSQLSGMKKKMRSQQRNMNLTGLRSALQKTLQLSKNQEELRKTIEKRNRGPSLREFAPDQQVLTEDLQHVADSLQSIAGRLPEMSQAVQKQTGNALRAMEQATEFLDKRQASQATGHQKTSMLHLNKLASLLSDLLDQMQKQSGGGSGKMSMQQLMKKLQQASGKQQKLNQQIQKYLNKVQGDRLSKNMEKRRKQLAKQQQQIKEQLEDLNVGSEAKEKILGDLKKIAEQMEESAEDLRRDQNRQELLERQQQIMTRLLNAQQSLRTQGKKDQRKGRTADSPGEKPGPGERPNVEEAETLRRDLIRALEMDYTPDYKELIKRYFELLQKREKQKQE